MNHQAHEGYIKFLLKIVTLFILVSQFSSQLKGGDIKNVKAVRLVELSNCLYLHVSLLLILKIQNCF